VERWTGTGWVPGRVDIEGRDYGRVSPPGYYLDDEFVEPSTFAGCDLVARVALQDLESPSRGYVGDTTEYLRTGSAPPPAAYVDAARRVRLTVARIRAPWSGRLSYIGTLTGRGTSAGSTNCCRTGRNRPIPERLRSRHDGLDARSAQLP